LQSDFPLETELSSAELMSKAVYKDPHGGYFATGHFFVNRYGRYAEVVEDYDPFKKYSGFTCHFYEIHTAEYDYSYSDRVLMGYVAFFKNLDEVKKYYSDIVNLGLCIYQMLSLYYHTFDEYSAHYLKYFANCKARYYFYGADIYPKEIKFYTPEEERKIKRRKNGRDKIPELVKPCKILDDCFKHFKDMTKYLLSRGYRGGWRECRTRKHVVIDLTLDGGEKKDGRS
jgi:hypothetical protein